MHTNNCTLTHTHTKIHTQTQTYTYTNTHIDTHTQNTHAEIFKQMPMKLKSKMSRPKFYFTNYFNFAGIFMTHFFLILLGNKCTTGVQKIR